MSSIGPQENSQNSENGDNRAARPIGWLLGITITISIVLGVLFTDAFMFRLSHWSDGFYADPPAHDAWHASGESITTVVLAIIGAAANLAMLTTASSIDSSPANPKRSSRRAAIVCGIIGLIFCLAMLGYAPSMN
jgi:uncharacterized membrane protein